MPRRRGRPTLEESGASKLTGSAMKKSSGYKVGLYEDVGETIEKIEAVDAAPEPNAYTKSGQPLDYQITEMQRQVFTDPHQFIVLSKGRRTGGTTGAAINAIKRMLRGEKLLWVDTVQGNLSRYIDRIFMPILGQLKNEYWSWNEQKKILRINDGFMDMRSAERPENIEGFGYHAIYLNEAGIILNGGEYLWFNAIVPMIMDYKAQVYFIGTPKGKTSKSGQEHLFYTFYLKGLLPENKDWKSYQITSYMNPFLQDEDLAFMEAECPAAIKKQELYAEFLDIGEDSIFDSRWWQFTSEWPEKFKIERSILSWDTAFKDGESNDYSVCTYWLKTYEKYYCMDMFMDRLTFPKLIEKTWDLYNLYKPDAVIVEDKASGQSLIQMFQQTSLPVLPFKIDRDKISRAVAITPLIEAGKVVLYKAPWNKALIDQCSIFPQGEYDDICFVAGTKIATPFGDKNIETLKIGNKVITPLGHRKIIAVHINESSVVIDRFGLKCTPNHPIFAENEFKAIDSLPQTVLLDILSLWTIIKWYLRTVLYSKAENIESLQGKLGIITLANIFHPCQGNQVIELLKLCIKQSGNFIMVRFLKAVIFTIKMAIQITMILVIYSVYRLNNIMDYLKVDLVQKLKNNIWKKSDHLHSIGINQKKVENGIKITLKKIVDLLKKKEISPKPVNSAEKSSLLKLILQSFVQVIVMVNNPIKMLIRLLNKSVNSAEKPSKPFTEHQQQMSCAQDNVQVNGLSEKIKVYNLEIDQAHCYYANKILVGNCDSLSQSLLYFGGNGSWPQGLRQVYSKRTSKEPPVFNETVVPNNIPGRRPAHREHVSTLKGFWD